MRRFPIAILPACVLISTIAVLGCGGKANQEKKSPAPLAANNAVELERQRADLEKQLREMVEAQLRERDAIEKDRQSLAESKARAAALAVDSERIDDSEFARIKEYAKENAKRLDQAILRGAHPTGTYGSTGQPSAYLSGDRRAISITLTVYWKGGLTESDYQTTYSARLDKRDGLSNLKAMRDTALVKIDPQFMQSTKNALHERFK